MSKNCVSSAILNLLAKLKFPHVIKNLKNIYHSKKKIFYARLATVICCAICFCAQCFYFSTSVWFIFSSFSMLRRDEIKFSFVDFFNWFFFQTPNWLLSNTVTSIIEFLRLGKGPLIYYVDRFWNIFWPTQSQCKHDLCSDSEQKMLISEPVQSLRNIWMVGSFFRFYDPLPPPFSSFY